MFWGQCFRVFGFGLRVQGDVHGSVMVGSPGSPFLGIINSKSLQLSAEVMWKLLKKNPYESFIQTA